MTWCLSREEKMKWSEPRLDALQTHAGAQASLIVSLWKLPKLIFETSVFLSTKPE